VDRFNFISGRAGIITRYKSGWQTQPLRLQYLPVCFEFGPHPEWVEGPHPIGEVRRFILDDF